MNEFQETYPINQESGQVGSNSRPLSPNAADLVNLATGFDDVQPGDGFEFDASGDAIAMADLADNANLAGVFGFEVGTINQTLAGGTNNTQGIAYNGTNGDRAKYYVDQSGAYVYVTAGAAVARNALVAFNPATGKWVGNANGRCRAAKAAAADGDILEIRLSL